MSSLKTELSKKHFRVTIFGSARIKYTHPVYKQVEKLAELIAKEGIDIVTGGGPGLMDAASRGHLKGRKSSKVHTIGLTISLPREQRDSYHLDVKQQFEKFSGRLDHFMQLSNAVVVSPGGVGTALEFFYTWQLIQVKHTCTIPVILLGDMWIGLLDWVKKYPLKKKFLDKKDLEFIYHAKTSHDAISIIKLAHEEYKKGGDNLCLNIKKYKVI